MGERLARRHQEERMAERRESVRDVVRGNKFSAMAGIKVAERSSWEIIMENTAAPRPLSTGDTF